jgi:hypothetical protein
MAQQVNNDTSQDDEKDLYQQSQQVNKQTSSDVDVSQGTIRKTYYVRVETHDALRHKAIDLGTTVSELAQRAFEELLQRL